MRKQCAFGGIMFMVAAALPGWTATEFVSGYNDGATAYAIIRRNGSEFRTDQMSPMVNQLFWANLSSADRHKLIDTFGWALNHRREQFGSNGSADMAAFHNDANGWSALVEAHKQQRMQQDYPQLKEVFGPGAFLNLPSLYSPYPEVRDSAVYRRATVLAAEAREDFEMGRKLYQTLTGIKWDQVSVAVKGISGPLIQIIVDNFMTGFITHGSKVFSEAVAAIVNFKVELEQFILDRQKSGSAPPTPAEVIQRIDKLLAEIEALADKVAADVTTKRSMLQGYATTIETMNQQIAQERQQRGAAQVQALNEQVAALPPPGTITIVGTGPTPHDIWYSKNQQCMAQYNQLISDAQALESALATEKSGFLASYNAAKAEPSTPEQVEQYYPEMQSRFNSLYAALRETLQVATPWATDALYAPARNQLDTKAGHLLNARTAAQRFLGSALERINALQARAGALDAYQTWMGSWNHATAEPIPATWTTTERLNQRNLRNLADVIGVIATNERETEDVAVDFKTKARFLDPPAPAFTAALADRKQWQQSEWQRYVSLRFNFENSLSFVLAALTQFDRLHQRPEFKVARVPEVYLVDGVEKSVIVYAVDIAYLKAQIDAQETDDGKQSERLRILQLLYDFREQELAIERRLEIAQNAHLVDATDMQNWRSAVANRYEYGSWENIVSDFKQGIAQTLVSQYDLYQNLTDGDPTCYYLGTSSSANWVRRIDRCRTENLTAAIEKISGKTATYYELLDLYNDLQINQTTYLEMSESAFNAFMIATTKKISLYPTGSLVARLQAEGVWGAEYPAWRLVPKTQWRQEALNSLYRSMSRQAVGTLATTSLLQRYPGINGRLTTEIGSPVAGAIVRLSGRMAEWTTTAADGSYAFDSLPEGTFVVTPPDGLAFTPPLQVVEFTGVEQTANFVLPDSALNGYTLAGRITDAAGDDVSGIRVQVTDEAGEFVADLITCAQGKFSLSGLAAASYTVRPLDSTRLFEPRAHTLQLPPSSALARFKMLSQPATHQLRASGALTFGEVAVGGSAVRTLHLHNDGNTDLRVEVVECSGGFSGAWRGVLSVGATQDVPITFTPAAAAAYDGRVTIFAAAVTSAVTIACSGTGLSSATAALTVEPLAFGSVTVGSIATRSLRLRNSGNRVAVVTELTLPPAFGSAWRGVVAADGSVEVPVTFAPTAVSSYSGNIVATLEGGGTVSGSCSGAGVTHQVPTAWLAARGLPTDGSVNFSDLDGDGLSVFQEWWGDTDPTDTRLEPAHVSENRPVGMVVGTLINPYPDPTATYTYTLVGGSGSLDNSLFTISNNVLKTAATFDYEAKSAYTIRVRRTNQSGLWYERQLTITVDDAGDAPTDISLSSTIVPEQRPRGTTVGEFAATDPDLGDSCTYTLVAGAGDTDNEAFEIKSYVLQTATSITYAVQNSFKIRVRATDRDGLFCEKAFTLTVAAPSSLRNLIVHSAHGSDETVVTNRYPAQTAVRVAMTNTPVRDATRQFVCTGWKGTGSAPASGATTDTGTFTLANDTTVTWQWRTNLWLAAAATSGGTVSGTASGWQTLGAAVTLTATADATHTFSGWSGDTNGCTIAGRTVTATMTQPRALIARFRSTQPSQLQVTPATRAVGVAAGTTTFTVHNSGAETIAWDAILNTGTVWARITAGASGENDGTITVAFDENPLNAPARTASLLITAIGTEMSSTTVTITQAANGTTYVLFDAQGGRVSIDQQLVVPGEPYSALPEPLRPGYTFDGWWTGSGGTGTRVLATTLVTATANHTLYAKWIKQGGGDSGGSLLTPGSYDGYFYATENFTSVAATAVRGILTLKVSNLAGKLSAKAMLQGGNVSFSTKVWSAVDANGICRATMTARSGETLDLFVSQNRIWGTLQGGKAGAAVMTLDGGRNRFADKSDTAATTLLAGFKGYYTVALPTYAERSLGYAAAAPAGVGYMTITIGNKGAVKIAGVLADGTKVSRASRLILAENAGTPADVPLFAPLYSKKGWTGGLLWVDPTTRLVTTDRDHNSFIRWEQPGKGADGFSMLLDACGGFYSPTAVRAAGYHFSAGAGEVAFYHAEGVALPTAAPADVAVTAAGTRLSAPRAAKPKKITIDGIISYDYDVANPAQVTLTFAARTGIFKGSFTLWYEYEAKGRPMLKGVKAPYSGILTPLRDPLFGDLPTGLGHCLIPETDPAFKTLRLKRSYPVWLEAGE